ncbi:MAG: TIGR02147 family protein [Myxococcales bacterium]|nr:MAG: TIGR02147 family protein [Myxococcales bacterium]
MSSALRDDAIMRQTKLDIFTYTDFRAFLKDRLAELKALDSKYSLRYLSDRLGLSSKSHLKMVVDGARNLSPECAAKLARVICLKDDEAAFFLQMVRYGQAKSIEEKQDALAEMRRRRRFLAVHQMELDRFDYLNEPLTLILREMVAFPDFSDDPAWIAARLPFRAAPKQVAEALEKLERLEMIRRDETGKWIQTRTHQKTGDALFSLTLKAFYETMFQKAAQSVNAPSDVRNLGGLTMAISRRSYDRLSELYRRFIDDARAIIDEDERPEQVYQLVMGLFPLTAPGLAPVAPEKADS